MDPSKETAKLTPKKKAFFCVTCILILAVLFLSGSEFVLRQKGVTPYQMRDIHIQVEPGDRFFTKHPTLGYTHIPGQFTVTLGTGYSFRITHLPNTLRITHPLSSYDDSGHKQEIWIFGCSFTHGWSLDDDQTYSWLLQESLQEYEIVNFGVSGYGTIHSLIQFRDALESKTPKVAVLAYAGFHDERNTFLRARRKNVATWNKLGPLIQPYAQLDRYGNLQYSLADVVYTEFPLMRHLASAHFLEIKWNKIEHKLLQSNKVSRALVMEMARLAQEHDVKFVVASISNGGQMLEFARQKGIPSVDISVDLYDDGHLNLPHDNHPSAIAHKKYADKLEAFLRKDILEHKGPSVLSDPNYRVRESDTARLQAQ
jgi:hypothetical protein